MQKRYPVDENDLFSHSHDLKLETKKFPWWKPIWINEKWIFQNCEEKFFDPVIAFNPDLVMFKNSYRYLCETQKYEMFSLFFVDWTKKIAYFESTRQWLSWEKKFKEEFPDHRPEQIAKKCDAEIAKYFAELKNGSVAQLV